MRVYYNEWDAYCAQWLRNLMAAGLIPEGDVDERSIKDVRPGDLEGYGQCHFFAGIGGWPYALSLAGWPSGEPVWTASCPCQPFSAAGKRKGAGDERHLWPDWFRLIRERRPRVVFGEQVEGAVRLGWLDGVFGDMEGEDYACGAAVLGAHSVGAPHIRQRLWWVADNQLERRIAGQETSERAPWDVPWGSGAVVRLADTLEGRRGRRAPIEGRRPQGGDASAGAGDAGGVGYAATGRLGIDGSAPGSTGYLDEPDTPGFWSAYDLLHCLDGKARRVEPGTFPLAHGVPARVGKLRAYGNAIVPEAGAEFVRAYMECRP